MSETPLDNDFSATAEEVLQRRAVSLAMVTGDGDVSQGLSLLLFRIADEWYAVEASDVREIFQDYEVTPVPCVPEYILGVVNVRGEILSVTDPARMMGIGSIDTRGGVHGGPGGGAGIVGTMGSTPSPAVVIANDHVATALVVDEVGDIVEVANGSIEPPISIIDRTQAEFVAGSVFASDRMVGLLNVERVLEPIDS